MKKWRFIFFLLGLVVHQCYALDVDNEKPVLKRVVFLMRHGVRAPTSRLHDLDQQYYTDKKWPLWPVPPDQLTPHGRELVTGLGQYFREVYKESLDIDNQGCNILDLNYSRADVAKRTVATAKAFIDGFGPGCSLTMTTEPLTVPLQFEKYPIAIKQAENRLGDYKKAMAKYHDQLALLQSVLQCCNPVVCHNKVPCTIFDVTGTISKAATLTGPLGIGGFIAQNFVLEKAEGFPRDQIGWGKITDENLVQLEALSSLSHDINNRTPYMARNRSSKLANMILNSMRPGTIADAPPRLVAFIGHDTNVGYIAGLFGLNWTPKTYATNFIPPASALVFELYYYPQTKKYVVRSYFMSQTLDQMAKLEFATQENPPEWVPIRNKLCVEKNPA